MCPWIASEPLHGLHFHCKLSTAHVITILTSKMQNSKPNKVVYKLSSASPQVQVTVPITPEVDDILMDDTGANVIFDPEPDRLKELVRVITHLGQQMTTMIWKMDKLEQQNEYLLKEMRRLKKGGKSEDLPPRKEVEKKVDYQLESLDEDVFRPNEPETRGRKKIVKVKKVAPPPPPESSSSEDVDGLEDMPDFPLKTLADVDQVIEMMKDPQHMEALKKKLKSNVYSLFDPKMNKRFRRLFSHSVLMQYSKTGLNNRRSSDDCPLFRLIGVCWSKSDKRAWIDFLNKRFDYARRRQQKRNQRQLELELMARADESTVIVYE